MPFDPSQPFEVLDKPDAKPAFDPTKPFEPIDSTPVSNEVPLSELGKSKSADTEESLLGDINRMSGGMDDPSYASTQLKQLSSNYNEVFRSHPTFPKPGNPNIPFAPAKLADAAGVASGIIRGVEGTAEEQINLENATLIAALGPAGPMVQKIAALGFGAHMIKGSLDQFQEASKAATPGEKAEGYTRATMSLLLGGLAAKHGIDRSPLGIGSRPESISQETANRAIFEKSVPSGEALTKDSQQIDPSILDGIHLAREKLINRIQDVGPEEQARLQAGVDDIDAQLLRADRSEVQASEGRVKSRGESKPQEESADTATSAGGPPAELNAFQRLKQQQEAEQTRIPKEGEPPSEGPLPQSTAEIRRIAGPALVDETGNVVAKGEIGQTHADLKMEGAKRGEDLTDATHVFVDDAGNKLTREEAAPIAEAAGQRIPETKGPLHSEHLQVSEDKMVGAGPGAMGPGEAADMEAGRTGGTGLKRSIVDTERLSRGAEEIPTPARQRQAEVVSKAEDTVFSDPTAAPSIISRIVDDGSPAITQHEAAILLVERQRLINERAQWEERLGKGEEVSTAKARLEEIEVAQERIDQAQRASGTAWGRLGRMYQQLIRDDYTLPSMERKLRAKLQRPLTPKESAELAKTSGEIEKATTTAEAAKTVSDTATQDAEVTAMYEATINELGMKYLEGERTPNQGSTKGGKKGERKPQDALANAKAESVAGEELSHKTVYEYVRSLINSGIHGENAVMKAAHEGLKKFFPDATERDIRRAFSEYGKVKFPSRDAVKMELSELRRLTQLQESIDRLTEGQEALKSGPQRDKATQAIREKQTELNELLKKRQGPPSPEQLATRDQAKQTALRNAIEDLDKQLKTGDKPAKGAPLSDSVETEQLRAERDAMRAKLKEIEDAANPGKTEAEKQVDRLSEIRKRLTETLSGDRPPNAPKNWTPLSAAAEDIRLEIDAMRELAAQLRKDAAPKTDPAAAKERARIRSLEESIKRYDEKISKSDFSTKSKSSSSDSFAVSILRAVRDARKEVYEAARKANEPVRTPEERYNDTRLKAVEKRTRELEGKMSAGDFTRNPKPVTPQKIKEVTDAEFRLSKIKQEFDKKLFEIDLKNRSAVRKTLETGRDVLNTARAVQTAFDLSAVLRQGGFITIAHPIRALKSFGPMFKAFASEKGEFASNQEIQSRPNAPLYQASKLHLNDPGTTRLSKMEEAYMSRWASKIPGVSHSARAYTTFLNKLRADSFDAMAESIGKGRKLSIEEAKAVSNFINVATGRGNLAGAAGAAISLNTAFFAPRYVVSRFELLAGQPLYKGTASTRFQIAKEYARFLGGIGVMYALSQAAGATVEKDPRSADFGKLKFGNTRVDPLSGLSQSTVLASRMITGKTKTKEGLKDIRGSKIKFGQPDSADIAGRFLRTKLSPIVGTAVDISSGSNVVGQPVTPGSAAVRLIFPLSFGDIYNAMQDQGMEKGTAISLLALFGMGVQTYEDKKSKKARQK